MVLLAFFDDLLLYYSFIKLLNFFSIITKIIAYLVLISYFDVSILVFLLYLSTEWGSFLEYDLLMSKNWQESIDIFLKFKIKLQFLFVLITEVDFEVLQLKLSIVSYASYFVKMGNQVIFFAEKGSIDRVKQI